MDYREAVIRAAKILDLLDARGNLVTLDSLAQLDLVETLEHETSMFIPTATLREGHFVSVDAIVALLTDLSSNGTNPND
jgi:hypothetical protein